MQENWISIVHTQSVFTTTFLFYETTSLIFFQQECIPVVCVPSAAVAVLGGGSAWGGGVSGVGGCLPGGRVSA